MTSHWLYMYENKKMNSIYIGIASSMKRVYEPHNQAAMHLRDDSESVVLQTVVPFSSHGDARKAEAIAIHVATIAGTMVSGTDNGGDEFTYTNISGAKSTAELGPAIFTQPGIVQWTDLSGTVIVPISADQLDGRPAPFGAHGGAFFAERASKFWQIAPSKRPNISRLIALLKGSQNIILGDWDVDPKREWVSFPHDPKVEVPLKDPERDDPRHIKGQRLEGHRMNSGVTYSSDLK